MTKISIIVPVYNVASYLPKCLDSILSQTYQDFEVICVDDCSTDGSQEVLKLYASRDSRFKIYINENNIGGALTRNNGLNKAVGEYIYFMDSDDWIELDYLEKMLSAIDTAKTDIVLNMNILQETPNGASLYTQTGMKTVDDKGTYLNRWEMIANTPCTLWARLYKRDFFSKYNLSLPNTKKTCEDLIFHYISQIHTDKSFAFMGPAYHYRIHKSSITGTTKANKIWDVHFIAAYDAIYEYYKEHGFLNKLPIKIFNVMSCFIIDNEEKFDLYRTYLLKVKDYINANEDTYNALDRHALKIVTECATYKEYKEKHMANLMGDFLRKKMKND